MPLEQPNLPATTALVRQQGGLVSQVLSLHKSEGGEWGLNGEVWDENEIPTASAELHPL